jgi:2-oxoglutarate ferredoxin oxidoreductase subunit alpha
MSVDVQARDHGPLPPKDWALDGTAGGTGKARQIWTWAMGRDDAPGPGPDAHWRRLADKFAAMGAAETRHESLLCDDAEWVVVSFGTSAPFVDHVVEELRGEGVRIGSFRPVTLWPFPEEALARCADGARGILVYEVNAGQMVDDVRLSVGRGTPVRFIGGVSIDSSGMRQGDLLTVAAIRDRTVEALASLGAMAGSG